jgi:hypothetical protein
VAELTQDRVLVLDQVDDPRVEDVSVLETVIGEDQKSDPRLKTRNLGDERVRVKTSGLRGSEVGFTRGGPGREVDIRPGIRWDFVAHDAPILVGPTVEVTRVQGKIAIPSLRSRR